MNRILTTTLIIRFSSVGDIILTSPLIRTLRARFPQSRIDFLVKEEYADLVRHNPHLSRTLLFPAGGTSADLRRFRSTIQAARYDLILDMHDSIRSRVLCCGRTPVLRYRKRRLARFALIHGKLDVYSWSGGAPPIASRYLEPVRSLGVEDDGRGVEVFIPDEAHRVAGNVLDSAGIPPGSRLLGLCPSARHATKMWLPERFAGAAASLARTYALPVVLFGSAGERERCASIAGQIRTLAPDVPVCNCAGAFSLLETAAAMDRCAAVITNDTGLMHLASARKRPVVALFGPTVRQFGFFPGGTESRVVEHPALPCRPCTAIGQSTCPRGHFRCMQDIHESHVVAAAHELLDRT
jgi:lipopolysaccharide heptosyltransferase II